MGRRYCLSSLSACYFSVRHSFADASRYRDFSGGDVGFAPKATVGRQNAIGRYGP